MQQHPLAFEFTPKLLAVLLHCSSSLRFGAFLCVADLWPVQLFAGSFFCNNELEREQLRLKASENNRRIRCLWTYLESGHAEKEFGNEKLFLRPHFEIVWSRHVAQSTV